jgi:hypothetical protein
MGGNFVRGEAGREGMGVAGYRAPYRMFELRVFQVRLLILPCITVSSIDFILYYLETYHQWPYLKAKMAYLSPHVPSWWLGSGQST